MADKEIPDAQLVPVGTDGFLFQENPDPRFKGKPVYTAGIAAGVVPESYDKIAVQAWRDNNYVVIEGVEPNELVKSILGDVYQGGVLKDLQVAKLDRLIDDALDDGKFNHSNVMNMPKPSRDDGPSR